MQTKAKLVLLVAATVAAPGVASAQTEAPVSESLPAPSAAPGAKRPVPRYDGRPEAPAGVGASLVWVPRAALYPARVVAEYGVRRPMVGAIAWSEEHFLVPRLRRVFTTDDGKAGLYPYFIVDTGLRPRFGAVAFYEELGHPTNDLRLGGNFATRDAWMVSAQDRVQVLPGGCAEVVVRAAFATADDNRFHGLGPDTHDDAARFGLDRAEASVTFDAELRGRSRGALFVRARDMRFGGSRHGGSARDLPTTHGGPGQPPLPPGWGGYRLIGVGSRVALDSRSPAPHRYGGTGVRLEAGGDLSAGSDDLRFAEWGGELAGFLDVTGRENVLGARVAARFQENLGDGAIPFTEKVSLGGNETMRAFLPGRLRGDSAFLAEVQYRYVVWVFLDAELFSSVGNTFDGHLDGLRPGALFWTSGLSLRTTFSKDSAWAAGVAIGSNRFDADRFRAADHVRLFAGLNQGF